MDEKDIIIIQSIMAKYSLSAETKQQLIKMMEEGSGNWTEKSGKQPVTITAGSRPGANYISCPYTEKEKEKIMDWIDRHPYDVNALAVALWLEGDISPQEIINLRKEDFRNGKNICEDMEADKRLSQRWSITEIVQKALKLHPDDLEFVFMFSKKTEWKKLNGSSIQMKLYNICDEVGITYKPFHKNEAIALHKP